MAAATMAATPKSVLYSGGVTTMQSLAESSEEAPSKLDLGPPALSPKSTGRRGLGVDTSQSSGGGLKKSFGSTTSLHKGASPKLTPSRGIDTSPSIIPLFQNGGGTTMRRPYMTPRAASYTGPSKSIIPREDSCATEDPGLEMKRSPSRPELKLQTRVRTSSAVASASLLALSTSAEEVLVTESPSRPALGRSQTSQSFIKRTFFRQSFNNGSSTNLALTTKSGEEYQIYAPSSPKMGMKIRSRTSSFVQFKSFITGSKSCVSVTNSPKLHAMLKDPPKVPDLNSVDAALDELRISPDKGKAKEPYITSLFTLSTALAEAATKTRSMLHQAMQARDAGKTEICRGLCIRILHGTDPPSGVEMRIRACNILATIASSKGQSLLFLKDAKALVRENVHGDPELEKYLGVIAVLEKAFEKVKVEEERESPETKESVEVEGLPLLAKSETMFKSGSSSSGKSKGSRCVRNAAKGER